MIALIPLITEDPENVAFGKKMVTATGYRAGMVAEEAHVCPCHALWTGQDGLSQYKIMWKLKENGQN